MHFINDDGKYYKHLLKDRNLDKNDCLATTGLDNGWQGDIIIGDRQRKVGKTDNVNGGK